MTVITHGARVSRTQQMLHQIMLWGLCGAQFAVHYFQFLKIEFVSVAFSNSAVNVQADRQRQRIYFIEISN